jgi:hypothetical protein
MAALVLLITSHIAAESYEPSLVNLHVPSRVHPIGLELTIQHRFSRVIGKPSQYSLLDAADVRLTLRGQFWRGLGVQVSYGVGGTEFEGGIGYAHEFITRWLQGEAVITVFTFEDGPKRATNLLYLAAISSDVLPDRLVLAANLTYDGYFSHLSAGAGFLLHTWPLLDLIGEYVFLHHDPRQGETELVNAFAVAANFNVYNHHFKLIVTNAPYSAPRQIFRGAPSNDLRFGFSIQKLFQIR